MKKEKKIMSKSTSRFLTETYTLTPEADQAILDQINKRKEENQALKKLLDNLNSSISKSETRK
jgi:hypothetical protein